MQPPAQPPAQPHTRRHQRRPPWHTTPAPTPAEIGGGWLVWQTVRNKKPWYYLLGGFFVLCAYGLVPTLQPQEATFARVYAAYGGLFIVLRCEGSDVQQDAHAQCMQQRAAWH